MPQQQDNEERQYKSQFKGGKTQIKSLLIILYCFLINFLSHRGFVVSVKKDKPKHFSIAEHCKEHCKLNILDL